MRVWQWGLILVVGVGLVNGLLVSNNIGGVIRELMRLAILVGFGLLLYGLIRKK